MRKTFRFVIHWFNALTCSIQMLTTNDPMRYASKDFNTVQNTFDSWHMIYRHFCCDCQASHWHISRLHILQGSVEIILPVVQIRLPRDQPGIKITEVRPI